MENNHRISSETHYKTPELGSSVQKRSQGHLKVCDIVFPILALVFAVAAGAIGKYFGRIDLAVGVGVSIPVALTGGYILYRICSLSTQKETLKEEENTTQVLETKESSEVSFTKEEASDRDFMTDSLNKIRIVFNSESLPTPEKIDSGDRILEGITSQYLWASLSRAGLNPKYKVSVINTNIYLSDLFTTTIGNKDHTAAIGYVGDPNNRDIVTPRLFYFSEENGLWRVAPWLDQRTKGSGVPENSKGEEAPFDAVFLPFELTLALESLRLAAPKLENVNNVLKSVSQVKPDPFSFNSHSVFSKASASKKMEEEGSLKLYKLNGKAVSPPNFDSSEIRVFEAKLKDGFYFEVPSLDKKYRYLFLLSHTVFRTPFHEISFLDRHPRPSLLGVEFLNIKEQKVTSYGTFGEVLDTWQTNQLPRYYVGDAPPSVVKAAKDDDLVAANGKAYKQQNDKNRVYLAWNGQNENLCILKEFNDWFQRKMKK